MSHNTPSLRLDSNSSFGTQRLNMDVSTVRDGDRDRSIARDREGELTREKFRESGRERDRGDRERDREERGRDTDADPNPPSSSSSYFIPNYPFSEPLFYIPRIPSITKVPEPQAPKRPPPAGYDMRTLRRQLSFLNEELGEQAQTQVLLHTQNEQLWMYVQDLLEANKANAHLMRGEVLRLHGELKHVHKERYQVAEKLLLARNSKSLLADLQRDLRETQLSAEEVEARKAEAETALLLARQESSSLAEALSSQAQQMQGVHGELEGYRQRQAEEQSLDLADSFFASNRAVLRAAYFRFRTGVQGRFRLSRIHSALERVYRRHLQRTVLDLWAHYLKRRQMMHRSRGHRRREALGLCLAQWQVFAALERLFSQARRRLVLQRCFRGWRAGAQEGRFEGWAVRAGGELRRQQWTRRVFQAWRGQTLFFEWSSPLLLLWEQKASKHFKTRILRAWRGVTVRGSAELAYRASRVPAVVQAWHFSRWHQLCGSMWRRRGRLLRRFYRHMRRMVSERAERAVTQRFAVSAYVALRQRRAFRRWGVFLRNRRSFLTGLGDGSGVGYAGGGYGVGGGGGYGGGMVGGMWVDDSRLSVSAQGASTPHRLNFSTSASTLPPSAGAGGRRGAVRRGGGRSTTLQSRFSLQVVSHMKRRWLRSALLLLTLSSSVQRRQRLCLQAGMRHYILGIASRALSGWRTHARIEVRARRRHRRFLLKAVLGGWRQHLREQRRLDAQSRGLAVLGERVALRWHVLLLNRWRRCCRTSARLRRCQSFVYQKALFCSKAGTFRAWRVLWTRLLLWRLRELQVEAQRAAALAELNGLALRDVQQEKEYSRGRLESLGGEVADLQHGLVGRNITIANQGSEILSLQREKDDLLGRVGELQREVGERGGEVERLRAFEGMLSSRLQQQQAEKEALEVMAADVMTRVEAETAQLRGEVREARRQSVMAEKTAEQEVLRSVNLLQQAQEEAAQLQVLLSDKRAHLEHLEETQHGLLLGLERVQGKLGYASEDGLALLRENQALLRGRGSAVRVLRSDAGLAEARVQALREAVGEAEGNLGRMRLSEVLENENAEMRELHELQRQLHEHQQNQALGRGAWDSHSHSLDLLSHSHSQEGQDQRGMGGGMGSLEGRGVSLYHNVLSPSAQDRREGRGSFRASAVPPSASSSLSASAPASTSPSATPYPTSQSPPRTAVFTHASPLRGDRGGGWGSDNPLANTVPYSAHAQSYSYSVSTGREQRKGAKPSAATGAGAGGQPWVDATGDSDSSKSSALSPPWAVRAGAWAPSAKFPPSPTFMTAALDSDCDNNTDDNNNTENNEAETLLSLGIGEGESGVQGVGEVRGGGVERGGGAGSSSSSEASSGPRSSPVHTMGGGRALADEAEGAGEGGDGDGDEEGSSIHDSDDENDTDNVDEGEFQDSGTEGSISVLQML